MFLSFDVLVLALLISTTCVFPCCSYSPCSSPQTLTNYQMVYSTIIHDPLFIHYCCLCHMIDHRFHYFSRVGSNNLIPTPLHQVINYKLQVGLQHIKLHLPNTKNPLGYLDSLTTFEVSHCFCSPSAPPPQSPVAVGQHPERPEGACAPSLLVSRRRKDHSRIWEVGKNGGKTVG